MKLYEIEQTYLNFINAVENGEIPEDCIADTLESIAGALEEKADNIACLIKNLTAEAAAIKVEEKNLADRRKSKEGQIEWYKQYLSNALQNSGYDKLETARNKITFRKSESVKVADEMAFIEWAKANNADLLSFKEPTINRTAIKQALAAGEEITGAEIEAKNNIQIK